MGWFVLWGVVALVGVWLRWSYADPMVERLWENSQEAGGGLAAKDSIDQLGRFVEQAGFVLILVAVFMTLVQLKRLRERSPRED